VRGQRQHHIAAAAAAAAVGHFGGYLKNIAKHKSFVITAMLLDSFC